MSETRPHQDTLRQLAAAAQQAIAEDPELFELVGGRPTTGLWARTLEGPPTEWNSRAFWNVLGRESTAEPGRKPGWNDLLHPDDRPAVTERPPPPGTEGLALDRVLRFRHVDDHWIRLHCRGRALARLDGGPEVQVGTFEELSDLADELSKKTRDLQSLAAFVSHDLRAPLRSISGFVSLLAGNLEGELSRENQDWVQRIRKGTVRIQAMIDQVLEYTRAHRSACHPTWVELGRVVESVRSLLAERLEESAARFDCQQPASRVFCDAHMMQRALVQLVDNCIKYRGAAAPQIDLSVHLEGANAEISIADHGIGIPAAVRSRVLEPFERGPGSEGVEGLGLGLAITQQIADQHGGQLHIDSESAVGTTIRVSIPHPTEQQEASCSTPL